MSDVIGDTAELRRNTIQAKASYRIEGQSGAFHFRLSEADGIKKYFASHAKVKIQGTVTALVSGPAQSTIATTVVVAVCPDKYPDWPTQEDQIVQLQGSTRIQHNILVPQTPTPIPFGNEVAEVLKPKTLVDYPPVVVGYYTIAGGSQSSYGYVILNVTLTLEGVAHHKTW